jgi:hypothetical protein
MGASQFMDNRKRCVPKGSRLGGKNSPAFERRGLTVSQQVPQEGVTIFGARYRDRMLKL